MQRSRRRLRTIGLDIDIRRMRSTVERFLIVHLLGSMWLMYALSLSFQDCTTSRQGPPPRYIVHPTILYIAQTRPHPHLSSSTPHGTFHELSYPCFKHLLNHHTFFVEEGAVLFGALCPVLGKERLATTSVPAPAPANASTSTSSAPHPSETSTSPKRI